jgi:hypothetical protein
MCVCQFENQGKEFKRAMSGTQDATGAFRMARLKSPKQEGANGHQRKVKE